MKRHTKNIKKILAFMMLSALVITLPGSIYSYAADMEESTGNELNNTPAPTGSDDNADSTSADQLLDNEQPDITKPLIGKVVFDQQGTTLKKNDIVTLKIYPYDEDSKITNIQVILGAEGGTFGQNMYWAFDPTENCYVCTYTLTDTLVKKVYISSIQVEDEAGNDWEWREEKQDGTYEYWAMVDQRELTDLQVKNFEFKQNGKTVTENELMTLSVEIPEEINSDMVRVCFENTNGGIQTVILPRKESTKNQYSTDQFSMNIYSKDGKWILKEIFALTDGFALPIELSMEGKENYSFILKKTEAAETDNPDKAQELPEEKLNSIVEQIKEMKPGAEPYRITMDGAAVVSMKILEAAKGKYITLNFDMGGYTWTINGMDIVSSNLQDINMQVILDTNHIPSAAIHALAGDNPFRQLSLTHEGDFGFKAALTVNMGTEYAGHTGSLYYYDNEGKMVFIDAGTIALDGNINLQFSHASDYVIVISDRLAEIPGKPEKPSKPSAPGSGGSGNGSSGSGSGNSTNKPQSVNTMSDPTLTSGTLQAAENNTQSQVKSVNTGDSAEALPWIVCSMSAFGIMIYLMKKRKSF